LKGYRAGFWMAFALGCVGLVISFSLTGIGKVGANKKEDSVVVVVPKDVEGEGGENGKSEEEKKNVAVVVPKDIEGGENSKSDEISSSSEDEISALNVKKLDLHSFKAVQE